MRFDSPTIAYLHGGSPTELYKGDGAPLVPVVEENRGTNELDFASPSKGSTLQTSPEFLGPPLC